MLAQQNYRALHRVAYFARPLGMLLLTAVAVACWCAVGSIPATMAADKAPMKEKPKGEELPRPEDTVLPTADGLQLAVTYYPGTKGKQTIPIVLLHGWKQSRNDYKNLAMTLQKLGHAVIVPDLRGHGDSKRLKGGRRDETLSAASMAPQQFTLMVAQDMEAVKGFLWERNNNGELNIEKLCVVGAEMGASVALNFALADAVEQDRNRVVRPEYRLGRFVKAMVLISPERSFKGLPIRMATAHPAVQRDIALLILVGAKDGKAMEETRRIHAMFERFHLEPAGDERAEHKTLFLGKLDTSLQGTKLLDPKFKVPLTIATFIDRCLVKSEQAKEWTWREHKVPHG